MIACAHHLGLVPIDACYLKVFNPHTERYHFADLFHTKQI